MNCPYCANPTEEGGLIASDAAAVSWHPQKEFEKKWFHSLYYKDGKTIGTFSFPSKKSKSPMHSIADNAIKLSVSLM